MIKEKHDKNLVVCILCSLVMAAAIFGTAVIKGNGAFTIFADFSAIVAVCYGSQKCLSR
ncbi:MAG: hypothetical protein ACIRZH_03710 [Ligilactobacillus ruminis]